ncbi:MAG: helicase-related protein [Methanophagales archaeon]|nr:helicase-related protein [Methanophagales archaeon]
MTNNDGPVLNIVDNSPDRELIRVLKDQIRRSEEAKFAIGYFFLTGFSLVESDFPDNYDNSPFLKIVMGNETTYPTKEELFAGYKLRELFKQRMIEDLQKRKLSEEQVKQLRTLKDFVANNVIDVKLYEKSRLHAKLYLFLTNPEEKYASPGLAVVGSSNFTAEGLTRNKELNVLLTSREEVLYLNEWFDNLWEEALEFREDLLKVIDFSGVLPESPYPQIGELIDPQVLFKYLVYRWFEGRVLNLLKRDILMEFQLVGVVNAVSIDNFYNGVILADSVGLGKSFMASAVIEEFLNGKHPTWVVSNEKEPAVLLILPPSIISQWEELLIGRIDEDTKIRLFNGEKTKIVSDYFFGNNFKRLIKNYNNNKIYEIYDDSGDKLLGRVAFLSLGIFQNMKEGELKRLAEEYDLFVIDEAHKFRNKNTHRWKNVRKLQKKSDNFPNKFLLLTATPLNNSINDIFNLIRLFIDDTFAPFRIKGIPITDLIKKYRDLKRNLEKRDDDKIRKDLKKVATEIKRKILDEIMVLRTRKYIIEQFKDLKVNGKPLVFKDPKPYRLDYSPFYIKDYRGLVELVSKRMDSILFEYTKLYGTRFVVFEGEEEEEEEKHYVEIADLFKLLLGKRLESGIYPFETTLRRIYEKERIFYTIFKTQMDAILSEESLREAIKEAVEKAKIKKELEEVLEEYNAEEEDEETWFDRVVKILLGYAEDLKEEGRHYTYLELLKLGLKKVLGNLENDLRVIDEIFEKLNALKEKGNGKSDYFWADLTSKQQRLLPKGYYKTLGRIPRKEDDIIDLDIFCYHNDPKLEALKQVIGDPSVKSEKLRSVSSVNKKKIIIFTQYRDTAYYLYHNLLDWADREIGLHTWLKDSRTDRIKIGLVTGDTETSTKINYIKRFAPQANNGYEEAKRYGELEILVSTDALSEGVNLQDADAVINYDLPWNPMIIVQRVGRVNRIGNEKDVYVINFIPSGEIEVIVGILKKLKEKISDITLVVGKETKILSSEEEISVETFGEKIRDLSQLSITDLEQYGISEDFKEFIPEGIPQEQVDEYKLLNIIQYDLGFTFEDFKEVMSMEDGPYYSFINSDVEKIIDINEFYRGKYKIMKKIMGINPYTKEINPETAIAFLDLIKKGRKNPEKIESAIESLKALKDETGNIVEDLKEKYQQEQRGFLYNLYNALLVEREKAEEMEDKFKVVMTALQAIPYYLYTKEIKPMLIEKNLIEMSRDEVIIKDFKGAVEALFDFFRERGLTDIESLKIRVNHLGWYYEL